MLPAEERMNRLVSARDSGVLRVEVDGQVVQYRSLIELEHAIGAVQSEIHGGGIVTRQAGYSRGAI
ncbi:phage head-tail joining protein [Elstera litoralis]|uniref:phage head-tail joining protein n=1 Tax=Elstera litoralis TaxID=552518 RepID=UPI0012EDA6EF|nr:hypothetical protein [Elstera litoralis]